MKNILWPLLVVSLVSCGGGDTVAPMQSLAPSPMVDCAGPYCSARRVNVFSGIGIGIWKYQNSTDSGQLVDIDIGGIPAGSEVTLVFSNGSQSAASSLPAAGALGGREARRVEQSLAPEVAQLSALDRSQQQRQAAGDAFHTSMLEENAKAMALLRRLPRSAAVPQRKQAAAAAQGPASPALGTMRDWIDLSQEGAPVYATTAQAVCPVGNGRNAVIWVDPNAQLGGLVTADNISALVSTFCGEDSGSARVTALLGDYWGPNNYPSDLISDSPLQDINIAIVDVPESTPWAGYHSSINNIRRTVDPAFAKSNEALVFFINASQLHLSEEYVQSTLLHEATHMLNFYQQGVVRDITCSDWLNETSAMMTEDIVVPSVVRNADGTGYNTIVKYRLPRYIASGGAVSYVNWSIGNYSLGGAFGAYLNRRFGLSIYRQIVTDCAVGSTSYECLDALIKANGGLGFVDEFAHFGASVFGLLPATGSPAKYGFPARTDQGYELMPIDASAYAARRPATAKALDAGYTATTQTYSVDTPLPSEKRNVKYVRSGVRVPAQTTLVVVERYIGLPSQSGPPRQSFRCHSLPKPISRPCRCRRILKAVPAGRQCPRPPSTWRCWHRVFPGGRAACRNWHHQSGTWLACFGSLSRLRTLPTRQSTLRKYSVAIPKRS
jgi:hypothetical protein